MPLCVLTDEELARVNDVAWLETEAEVARAEAARMMQYAQRCQRRLVELRGKWRMRTCPLNEGS